MTLLGGREVIGWSGVPCLEETTIALPSPPSASSISFQQESQKETTVKEEEQPFDTADKSDSQLLELAENGVKWLQGKLELVIIAKKEYDAFLYWEFPLWMSQSKLGGRTKPSDACTLICISVAEAFLTDANLSNILTLDQKREGFSEEQQLAMNWHKVCPPELIRLMKEAIGKGNKIYEEEKNRGRNSVFYDGNWRPLRDILSIPHAVEAWNRREESLLSRLIRRGICGAVEEINDRPQMIEIDFIAVKGSIGYNLPRYVEYAVGHPAFSEWNTFCFIVICSQMAISLVYSRDTDRFCVMDSHEHDRNTTGPIVAVSNRDNFPQMAEWMGRQLFRAHNMFIGPTKFELSLVQVNNEKALAPVKFFANFPSA